MVPVHALANSHLDGVQDLDRPTGSRRGGQLGDATADADLAPDRSELLVGAGDFVLVPRSVPASIVVALAARAG